MLIAILLSFTIILPGVFVLANRRKTRYELLFLGLSACLSLWVFSNYLVDNDIQRALVWTRATFFWVVWACYFFFEFVQYFPEKRTIKPLVRTIVLIVTVLLGTLTLTPMFIDSVNIIDGFANFNPGLLYAVFLIYYPVVLVFSLAMLLRSFFDSEGIARTKIKIVMLAIIGMTVLTSMTNLILPEVFRYSGLVPYGGYATLIFTIGVAYAMLRHHLFDVRAAAARAAAYVLSIGMIVIGYSFAGYILTDFASPLINSELSQRLVVAFLIALSALSYQSVKKFFDQITNKVFYRDAYDPQNLIDELNKVLVGEVTVDKIAEGSMGVIQKYLKTDHCSLYLVATSFSEDRILGRRHNSSTLKNAVAHINTTIENLPRQVYSPSNEAQNPEEAKFIEYLQKRDIEVYVPLDGSENEHLGYLIIGPKRSGSPYSSQDLKLFEIIANELVIAIENALRFEQIEKFNITLTKEVESATRQLRKTNDKLKALDEAKDEFISMASHQLRTPLTSIKGYISMVLEGDAGKVPPQQQEMLRASFTSAQRMVYLIADLLNVSRLQTGKFVIEPVDTNLAELVAEELAQLKEAAAAKKINIVYNKPGNFPTIKLDETKIRQVIMNFADNALYYTPVGGEVVVELHDKPKSIELLVKDNGIGVPKAEQHKLFTKFYRAGNARKARPDGTGLGLFMAQKVIISSGGAVIFKSTEGKGSTFGFTFPKK